MKDSQRRARPIFIAGRQHCGNTMVVSMLDKHPEVCGFLGEDSFFEHVVTLRNAAPEVRLRRVVRDIAAGSDPVLSKKTRESIAHHLETEVGRDEDPAELYARGKEFLTRKKGNSRWAQKATSYVFYVDAILRAFPDARILFLVRNPLDLAASMRRRGNWRSVGRTLWGWNRGVRRGLTYRNRYPQSVRVIRYEDLVSTTEEASRDLFSFCGLPYRSKCMEISHVNRSENPYDQRGEETGLDPSRVFYYSDVLEEEEEMAVRMLASDNLLEQLYLDLPPCPTSPIPNQYVTAGRVVLSGIASTVRDQAQLLMETPAYALRRIGKRLFGN